MCKPLILCGATAGVIRAAVEKAANFDRACPITEVDSYQSRRWRWPVRRRGRGMWCMLSPASASFDRFANFMERGRVFKESGERSEIRPGRPRIQWREGGVMAMIWRGFYFYRRRMDRRRVLRALAFLLMALALTVLFIAATQMRPLLESLATTRVSNAVTRIVSEAVYEAIEKGELQYDGLVSL